MKEILQDQAIKVERVRTENGRVLPTMPRELVGQFPAVSGEFTLEEGVVAVTVCRPDEKKQQKVILEGDVFPTTKTRGRKGQFEKASGRRRVLNFPDNERTELTQNMRPGEFLVFTRVPITYDRAAD